METKCTTEEEDLSNQSIEKSRCTINHNQLIIEIYTDNQTKISSTTSNNYQYKRKTNIINEFIIFFEKDRTPSSYCSVKQNILDQTHSFIN